MDSILRIEGLALGEVSAWSPAEWARLMAYHAGRLDLSLAIRVIRVAPGEIAQALSDALCEACPVLLEPANDR